MPQEVIDLIRKMSLANPRWGAPRIHEELLKLGLELSDTEHPTAEWMAHQLLEAFPWDSAPHYLLRDRDGSYGKKFHDTASWLGIRDVLTAPQSPWQNAYVERWIARFAVNAWIT